MKLAIVVPCYNEEKVIAESARQLLQVLESLIDNGKISSDSFLLFVNDGSRDNTWPLIEELHRGDRHVYGLSLALNSGHQNALMAGLMAVSDRCDAEIGRAHV